MTAPPHDPTKGRDFGDEDFQSRGGISIPDDMAWGREHADDPDPEPLEDLDDDPQARAQARLILLRRAGVRRLSDVTPERVEWLWPGYLPRGKLVMIDGDPSAGKSTLTTDLAGRCSTGSPWPDGSLGIHPAAVVLLSAEDGLADTIRPRLDAAGADTTRVFALTAVPVTGEDGEVSYRPPSLPHDLDVLEDLIVNRHAALVIVDVLMAYLDSRTDSHKDQDVRVVLAQLAAVAERTGACIILVRHLNKSGGGSPLYRGGGSIGIIGAARAGYLVGRDPEDETRRILACTKLNIGVEPAPLAYRLVSDELHGCARVEWETEPVDGMTAAALLGTPLDVEERSERNEAVEWLREYLQEQGGDAQPGDVRRAADAAGLTWRTVQRARPRVGASAHRSGFPSKTVWRLDSPVAPQSRQSRHPSEPGATGATVAPLAPDAQPVVPDDGEHEGPTT